jgi:alkanesulfonate monooxygenase SsuD/methylene tetrahydromethanopterin reductase-like flavin-dependent oxidoreductase (luciferase family)
MSIKIGLCVCHQHHPDPVVLARHAEELGFESFWCRNIPLSRCTPPHPIAAP